MIPTGSPVPVGWMHAVVRPFTEKVVRSGVLIVALLAVIVVVYAVGPHLKRRIGDEIVEVFQSVVVTVSGVIVAALLVVTWNLTDAVKDALGAVAPGPVAAVKWMVVLLVFAGAYTLTRISKRFVKEGAARDAITNHQREVLHHVLQIVIYVPAVLFALALWEADPSNLLLGAGVLGLVLGLAARQTLGAMLAGFVVLFSRPFEVDDWVVIDDHEGVVQDITIFNTRLRTFDDEQVMIPNDTVTATEVVNRSRHGRLRIQVDVGVDYETDVGHAADVALDAITDLDEPADRPEPKVVVERFGDSAVVLNLRFWIHRPSIDRKWRAQNAVIRAVKDAFEAEGIKIPFPQRELTGREEAGGFRVRSETDAAAEATPDGSPEDGQRGGERPPDAGPRDEAAETPERADGADAGKTADGGEEADGADETAGADEADGADETAGAEEADR